jgi:hypothetical protein
MEDRRGVLAQVQGIYQGVHQPKSVTQFFPYFGLMNRNSSPHRFKNYPVSLKIASILSFSIPSAKNIRFEPIICFRAETSKLTGGMKKIAGEKKPHLFSEIGS